MSDHRQPVQLLAETADTVTLRRADFEALLDEMEDAEDRIAVLESWVDELKDDGAGYLTPLTAEEVDRLLAGESPVKLWRDKRGMTQRELATAAGISQSQLAEIETGSKSGSIDTLRRLAATLKVQLDSLVPASPTVVQVSASGTIRAASQVQARVIRGEAEAKPVGDAKGPEDIDDAQP